MLSCRRHTTFIAFAKRLASWVCMCLFVTSMAWGQGKVTQISGTVTDQSTGEPLAFVQINVPNSLHGTVSDINGRFDLTVGQADTVVTFRILGYKPQSLLLKGQRSRRLRVKLEPAVSLLQEVNVTADRGKSERYRRKDNPAVALMQQVVSHHKQNDILATQDFSREVYEKLNMCLDQFHPNFETHRFWKHFPFVEKYIDQAEFDGAEILHFSVREKMSRQVARQGNLKTLITGQRAEGVDVKLDDEGLDGDPQVLFSPIDIFANEIDLMSVRFVSPLSPALGNAFYHYYITDTVERNGLRCIELSFIPSSKGNFGIVGTLYIVDDSSYAVQSFSMRVPEAVDLNFVRDLTVMQDFCPDSLGHLLPARSDVYCRLYIGRRIQQVYVHQTRLCHHYAFGEQIAALPDTLFKPLSTIATAPNARKIRRHVWNETRPLELTMAETFLDSIRFELMRIPSIRYTVKTLQVIAIGYIPTHVERDSSRFDIGSVYNFVSHNGLEGLRLRLGGMTTSRFSNRDFLDGYVAYGLDDRRAKFNLSYIHTFEPKRWYPTEWPLGYISLNAGYDVVSPGLSFDQFDRDNIFMWSDEEVPAQYVADLQLRLRKHWPSNIGIDTWLEAQHIQPTRLLNYYRITPQGSERVESIFHVQWAGRLIFTPGAIASSSRSGEGSLLNLAGNSSTFNLGHEVGYLDGFLYNRTTANAFSRIWLSAFGYLDLRAQGGWLWNAVPLHKLFIPNGNASPFMFDGAFSTMRPMEFLTDKYVSLFATYHLKGLILNHLPLINRLRLREVVSFNILYGGLSDKNNPDLNPIGLYQLPTNAHFLQQQPYAEYSIGIENILKLIRIDYVRRLTYLEGVAQPWAFKISLRFTM